MDKHIIVRVPKRRCVQSQDGGSYWVDLGEPESFMRLLALGVDNPEQPVVITSGITDKRVER